ncbi:MAG: SsrA-binding protein [Rickettsiales bacterium]|nr:SsrA-binding protein [Rickettsiales bacterium]OUW04484.1 MAG: SsrA-binding protein [Betaproteobacteria bacterium TMED156]
MSIVQNKKAFHEFFIEERFEAGIVLLGWEVKSIREGRAQIKEAYVLIKKAEIFLIGSHFSPLTSTSSHIIPNPTRSRKLLLKKSEIEKLIGKTERAGYSIVPLNLHFSKGKIKIEVGLAKGKKLHDKRQDIKDREWKRQEHRILKEINNPRKN